MSRNLLNIGDSLSKNIPNSIISGGIIDLVCVEFSTQINNLLACCLQDLISELKQHQFLEDNTDDCSNIPIVTKYIVLFKQLIYESGPNFKEVLQQEFSIIILNNANNRFIFNALINISDSLNNFHSYKK